MEPVWLKMEQGGVLEPLDQSWAVLQYSRPLVMRRVCGLWRQLGGVGRGSDETHILPCVPYSCIRAVSLGFLWASSSLKFLHVSNEGLY